MSREFAKKFYNSKAWVRCRNAYIASVFGLCEYKGCGRPGYILHHKKYLTPVNINNPEITLGWDNLEYLCQYHHNVVHGMVSTAEGLRFNEFGDLVEA